MSLCSHVHTCIHVYRASNRTAARMHTNPILLCISSARRPQGKKSTLYLAERWEPVFQVISVCRTKLNSPAIQVGGRAALARGADASCRAPCSPHARRGRLAAQPAPRGGKLHSRQGQSMCQLPKGLTCKTSETAALLTVDELKVRETGVWEAAA